MSIPVEIKRTLDWLIQIEEYTQVRELTLTVARHSLLQDPETLDFIAMNLYRAKFYQEALLYAQKTVETLPNQIEAHFNLARCLNSVGETAKAEEKMQWVSEQLPGWPDAGLELALYACLQGRFDEAETRLLGLQQALPPNDPHQEVIRFNLSWHFLRKGRFKAGMQAFCQGRQIRTFGNQARSYPKPKLLKGMSLEGKKILLIGEAGAGDEIINVRFAKTIHDRGGQALWASNQNLESLFSRVESVASAVSLSRISELDYDYWAPSMELFSILDLDEKDVNPAPYLKVDPEYLIKWRKKIEPQKKMKIGLRWQGNSLYEQDLFRSVPFQLFRKFFALEKADFYSLQRDSGLEDLQPSDPVVDLSEDLKTWEDTAAAISLLDVVVTSCTSIAHLAGALGVKTFVFTPMVSYYIWAPPGEKSIWYQDVTLFRQKKFHDWSDEADEIFKALQRISQ